jgi:hypothetical protein
MADDDAPDPQDANHWIAGFAARLEVDPPDEETVATLLELAGVAAHSSHRTAAPIACWLVGRARVSPGVALALAHDIGPAAAT